jgi:hypothetical protein
MAVSDLAVPSGWNLQRSLISCGCPPLGLVDGDRHGHHVVYSLYDDHVAELIVQAIYHAEHARRAVAAVESRLRRTGSRLPSANRYAAASEGE